MAFGVRRNTLLAAFAWAFAFAAGGFAAAQEPIPIVEVTLDAPVHLGRDGAITPVRPLALTSHKRSIIFLLQRGLKR